MTGASAISRRAFLTGTRYSAEGKRATDPDLTPTIVVISDGCLAHAGIVCMTCREACPEEAIRLRPRIGGPFLPEVIESNCTGCGACIAPCPADAITLVDRHANDHA